MASPSTPQYPKHSDSLHSLSATTASSSEAPKFKYKMIMVHLPFDQHSRVEVRKNLIKNQKKLWKFWRKFEKNWRKSRKITKNLKLRKAKNKQIWLPKTLKNLRKSRKTTIFAYFQSFFCEKMHEILKFSFFCRSDPVRRRETPFRSFSKSATSHRSCAT